MSQLLFLIISALGLAAALGTVLSRNLVHAALFLVGFFFVVSCQFVLLEAEFLAAVQVLIYIGAVAILMMFGIMLTRNIQGDDTTSVNPAWVWPAMVATLALFAVLIVGINNHAGLKGRSDWAATSRRPSAMSPPRSVAVNDMGRQVGVEMLTRYALPFEVAGLLLTAALVGAIALAHRDPEDSADEPGQRTAHDGHAEPMSGSPASSTPVEPLIGAGTG